MTFHRQKRRALFALAFLLPILFACSFLTSLSGGTPEAAGTGTPADESPPTPTGPPPSSTPEMMTIYTLEEGETRVPIPPSTSFIELLEQNEEEGTWQRGEGLVLLLSYFAAELTSDEIPGFERVIAPSGTGIFRRAGEYLQDPTADPETRGEIERLMGKLIPSREALEGIPSEESASRRREIVLTGVRAQGGMPAECSGLVTDGFDVEQTVIDSCYETLESETPSRRLAIYFPKWWKEDEEKFARVADALEALIDSADLYEEFGDIRDVNAIYGLQQMENTEMLGAEIESVTEEECLILLWPHLSGEIEARYKQALAHEAFHCFQDWNLPENPESSGRWWSEGSAEYFSNVVYPNTNLEQRTLDKYYSSSIQTSMFELDYENFLFFQLLGNTYGDPAVIELLQKVAGAGGKSGQLSALLNRYPDMPGLFQKFVVLTMSVGVRDTGGGLIVKNDPPLIRTENIEEEGEEEFKIQPFVAGRFAVSYEEQKRFLQEPVEEGDVRHSMARASLKKDLGAWSALPPEVRSDCDKDEKYALAISSAEGPATFKAAVSLVEKAECDPCLLGTWKMDNNSFEEFLDQLYETHGIDQTPAGPVEVGINGDDFLQFNEGGDMFIRRVDYEIAISSSGSPPLRVTTDAQGSAHYSADGEELTVTNLDSTANEMRMGAQGFEFSTQIGPQATQFSFFGNSVANPGLDITSESQGSAIAQYVCRDATLDITLPQGSVRFDRVDELLPTAMPTPDS